MHRIYLSFLLLLTFIAPAIAQPQAPLADFAGVYAYRDGTTVAIVVKNSALVAVLDDALYPLRRIGGDEFRNGAGQPVTFVRNERGEVTGVKEVNDYFPRQTATVPPDVAALALAAPRQSQAPYRYQIPARLGDGLEIGPAAEAGLSPAVLERLVRSIANETYPNVHGVLIWRGGRLVFEEYFYGYDRDRAHPLRSATKSVVSLLAGIAIDLGKIRDDKQPIAELLPWPSSAYKNPDPRKAKITVGDLLSMRTGLACDDHDGSSPGAEQHIYSQPDWARFTIDLPVVADPGTTARYCSGGVHLAGRTIETATGTDLLTFARTKLFDPLGLTGYRWPYQPVAANGSTFGQIYLRPRDMLKLGLLVLDHGRWQGRQLVSPAWIERSTAPLTQIGSKAYGYLWWHQRFPVVSTGSTQTVDTILATGNGGQKIYVVPSLQLVAVFTGGNYNSEKDTPPNEIMGNVLLPELLQQRDKEVGAAIKSARPHRP
jgi:CubicO group peptidase (beta-lactamase class C family)